jgi:tetratricopeptide (TPR) repeat protein
MLKRLADWYAWQKRPDECANAVASQAAGLTDAGRFADAVSVLREGLRMIEGRRGVSPDALPYFEEKLGFALLYAEGVTPALPHLERALALRVARNGATSPEAGNMLMHLGHTLIKSGQHERARQCLREAVPLLAAFPLHAAQSEWGIGVAEERLGNLAAAVSAFERAMSLLGDPPAANTAALQCRILEGLGRLWHTVGSSERACAALGQAVEAARRAGEPTSALSALLKLGEARTAMRDFEAALAAFAEARLLAEQAGLSNDGFAGDLLAQTGWLHLRRGDARQALQELTQAVELSDRAGISDQGMAFLLYRLCLAGAQTGDIAAAERAAWRSLLLHDETSSLMANLVQHQLARFAAAAGRNDLAIFFGKRAMRAYQGFLDEAHGVTRGEERRTIPLDNELFDLLVRCGRLAEAEQFNRIRREAELFDLLDRNRRHDPRHTPVILSEREIAWERDSRARPGGSADRALARFDD